MFTNSFSALATGGTIICSQYIGHRDTDDANRAAHQVMTLSLLTRYAPPS